MISISRLNHAVLYVRSLDRAVAFYRDVLGMHEISRVNGAMAFLRAPGSSNHHDLGLAAVGENARGPQPGSVGLYHLAWEVSRIEDLATVQAELARRGALSGASDHGATKSIYGVDPDGNEFEIMWLLPRDQWGEYENEAPTRPLHLERELRRYGSVPTR
ncbi:MAG: VOC family protein [Vulcanimicrobiaceae bacterium]